MKNSFLDKKKNIPKILLYTFVFCFALFFIYLDSFYKKKKSNYEIGIEVAKKESYRGVVIKKYRDKDNHNTAVLLLDTGDKGYVYDIFYNIIRYNDSIIKKKGETFIEVYREGCKFTLDNKDILKE